VTTIATIQYTITDDIYWFPLLLSSQTQMFRGHFVFSDFSNIKEHHLEKVNDENELSSFILNE